jgi:hypothetical protein
VRAIASSPSSCDSDMAHKLLAYVFFSRPGTLVVLVAVMDQ